MNNVLGVINLSINQPLLHELTYSRATATVPFGGRYRLIDFVLSNMVNSGIKKRSRAYPQQLPLHYRPSRFRQGMGLGSETAGAVYLASQ